MAKRETIDWETIRIDYITHRELSLRAICDKYKLQFGTLANRCRHEGWAEQKKKYLEKVVDRAISKAVTREANKLAKLITVSDNLTKVLLGAVEDEQQFYRQYVPETYGEDGSSVTTYQDKVSKKLDTRAVKDVAASIKMLEEIQRSLNNLQRAADLNRERREDEKLQLERERLELEKAKAAKGTVTDDSECGVVMLPEVLDE